MNLDTTFLAITLTDPKFLAAGAAALLLLGYVLSQVRRARGPTRAAAEAAGARKQRRAEAQRAQAEASQAPAKRSITPGKARSLAELVDDEEVANASLLSQFVLNNQGDTVGETMALDDEVVVLKTGDGFAAVALDAILRKDGMLLADANIDWDEARKAGEAWKEASTDEMEYDEHGMPVLDN